MSYSTKEEVREMLKDDALNAIIGDTFIEDPAEREELVEPLIEAAIADADAEIDGYLAKRYTVPISPAPRVLNKFSKDIAVYNLFPVSASTRAPTKRPISTDTTRRSSSSPSSQRGRSRSAPRPKIRRARQLPDFRQSQTPVYSRGRR